MTYSAEPTKKQLRKFRFTLECMNDKGKVVKTIKGKAPKGLPVEFYFKTITYAINDKRYSWYCLTPSKAVRKFYGQPSCFISAFYDGVEYEGGSRQLDAIIALIPELDYQFSILCRFPPQICEYGQPF